jgi:Protein of unknown function (DUF4446)
MRVLPAWRRGRAVRFRTVPVAQISTTELIAIGAAGGAAVSLLAALALAVTLRRIRLAQRRVLGAHGERDLIAHAAALEEAFHALREYVDEVVQRLDERLIGAERRLDGAVTHHALVRYDAYNEMSGHQSLSIALLDDKRSGIVVSSIHHRDQARMYAKRIRAGESELRLSPEEEEALRLALGDEG